MALQGHFFATHVDLEQGVRAFEAETSVLYVQAGLFDSAEPRRTSSAIKLGLGCASTGDMVTESCYLLLGAGVEPKVRPVPQRSGGVKFAIDQLLNPDSVVFCFGGVQADGVLISGEISSLGTSDASRAMFKCLTRFVLKDFEFIGSYWVGEQARQMLDDGWRLTSSVRSPVEYDLRRAPAN